MKIRLRTLPGYHAPDSERVNGTHLMDHLKADFIDLIRILGKPTSWDPHSEDEKISVEWVCFLSLDDEPEEVFTIYDWKRGGLAPWESDLWNIGGSRVGSLLAHLIQSTQANKAWIPDHLSLEDGCRILEADLPDQP